MNFGMTLRAAGALSAALGLVAPAFAQSAEDAEEATQLETITVVGDEPKLKDVQSPGEVSVVYPDDVKGEHKSLPDLLDQIPGVYARRVAGTGQYTTASIRGSSPSQVNIYIDGVPYNTASEAATDISTIPMSNVERVEVYRGTTPARFSGAPLGGAINIVTKRPDQARSSASAGGRSFGGGRLRQRHRPACRRHAAHRRRRREEHGRFRLHEIRRQSLDRIVYSDGTTYAQRNPNSQRPTDRTRLNNDYEKANGLLKWQNETVFAKWSYNAMERFMPTAVDLGALRWEDVKDPPITGVDSERRRQRVSEHNGAFGWRDTFGDLTVGATGTFMDQSKRYRNLDMVGFQGVGAIWSDYRTRRYGISGDAAYELGKDWALGHRLEVRAEQLWETLYADASDREGSDLLTRFPRRRSTIQAQDTITVRPLGDLEVTPVGRLEKLDGPVLGSRLSPLGGASGDYGWKPSWSLSAKKRLFDGWEVFANTGTYNRYPSFYEIYGDGVYVSPDLDSTKKARQLKREHGTNFDSGFGWTGALCGDWKGGFRLTYFQRRRTPSHSTRRPPARDTSTLARH
ncbi:TonB-dependent receptor plug domain-containing protein [Chenggangzhangella methanolivorans]|uniref:TonB-dependent receptor plug domain-containing protein n=1 Tax=Chenggangzhangella methanolivorans TaxID=1437009 RepID=A0A9E6UGX0_9HYPH|nr:TonB-dependent receptor plug domain-containing protein [Chenggangzhangella methanolivorans]QZN99177.1 TonB-dependent receptor plug domain-containing protein [Chenggangzhangella methanolivorans]